MKVVLSDGAIESLTDAPRKYDESNDVCQARVNKDWRFYFTIAGNTYQIEDVIPHPK